MIKWVLWILGLFLWSNVLGAKLVNSIVGKVSDEPVTSREVLINKVLEQTLYSNGNKKSNRRGWELTMNSPRFIRQVRMTLLERVLSIESQKFSLGKVSPGEIKKKYDKVKSLTAHWKYWLSLEVDKEELTELIVRKVSSKKFIGFRVKSTVVPITEIETRTYFERNQGKFGSLPFEALKKNINIFLSRRNSKRRLKDWFSVLKKKYNVRNFEAKTL